MKDMLNMQLRLACTSTFIMPCQIYKGTYVVLLRMFEKLDLVSTFVWEDETTFSKVLGDIVGSVVCAIFVYSSFNKDINTLLKIRPLLGLLITPQTIKL